VIRTDFRDEDSAQGRVGHDTTGTAQWVRVGFGNVLTPVGVEKLKISENQHKFGDRKCLGDPTNRL
jgi:hypothetical protein